MPPRSKSSQKWLKEHFDDPFVKQSRQDGYRSRAAYKLLEIDKKDHLLKRGMCVIDLGAAPGSFAQIAVERVGEAGKVIAMDLLPMTPINNVDFIQGDFRDEAIQEKIREHLGGRKVDVIISDMAPNMSGSRHVDIPRAMGLVEEVVYFASEVLTPGGSLLMKLFQGSGFDALLKQVRSGFEKAMIRKPEASRARSSECFLLAKGYKGTIVF
jgi:23S rRNA (uridine2552-2'-O)-methyltransferase